MARLIDADDLIRHAEETKITAIFPNYTELSSETRDAIGWYGQYWKTLLVDAPTIEAEIEKQEWIDVHNRLPDKDTLVLCVGAKGGMFLGFVRYLYGDDKTAYVRVPNARGGRYAAFWMPLPEPPKEEE